MTESYKLQQTKNFVAAFKEANKNTVQKVSKYDPVRKIWTFEVVEIDENVKDFAKKHLKTEAQKRIADKKEKLKKVIVTKTSPGTKVARQKGTKPKTEMRLNVVRLINEGKKISDVAKMYNTTPRKVSVALCKEKNNY